MHKLMSREDTPQIYVPALHREIVRPPVPESVLFFDPGLPRTEGMAGSFMPRSFPFDRPAAKQVLTDLLAIGESLDLASPKGKEAAREALAPAAGPNTGERDELTAFASGKQAQRSEGHTLDEARMAAHKVLLLAWDLEERLMEIAALRDEVAGAAKPLTHNLQDPSAPDHGAERHFTLEPDAAGEGEADWRLTLAAMATFLPADAVLVTRHAAMYAALLEAGMLLPLPEDVALGLTDWPDTVRASMLWTKAPLWRVLGRAREPEHAPWLLAAPEILVCSR